MSVLSIDQKITSWFVNLFNGNGWGVVLLAIVSILVASICAGLVGFEREYHGHSAGLRTHLLIAIGSAVIMIISIYGFGYTGVTSGSGEAVIWNRDPARLAAQVVSGIGFIGAGTIIQNGSDIKGLTTATTLWLVMAIGLAAGSGNFIICIVGTIFAFGVLLGMRKIEKIANKHNPVIVLVLKNKGPNMSDVLACSSKYGISLRSIDAQLVTRGGEQALRLCFSVVYASDSVVKMFVEEIREQIKPIEIKVSSETN